MSKTMKLFVDMDGVLCDFDTRFRQLSQYHKYPQSQIGFFTFLDPMPDAIKSLKFLNNIPELEVFILTSPSTFNPHCWTEKALWVEKHLGRDWLNRLIITERKELLFKNDGKTFLIDDCEAGKGQEVWRDNAALIQFSPDAYPDWGRVVVEVVKLLLR